MNNPVPKWFIIAYLDEALILRLDTPEEEQRRVISRQVALDYIENMECINGMIDADILTKFLNNVAGQKR